MTTEAFLDAFASMDALHQVTQDASPAHARRALACLEESLGISKTTSQLVIATIFARVQGVAERAMFYAGILVGSVAARTEAELGLRAAAAR